MLLRQRTQQAALQARPSLRCSRSATVLVRATAAEEEVSSDPFDKCGPVYLIRLCVSELLRRYMIYYRMRHLTSHLQHMSGRGPLCSAVVHMDAHEVRHAHNAVAISVCFL